MDQTFYDLLDHSLAHVARACAALSGSTKFYTFLPQRGSSAIGELLVVGRAPRGEGWWIAEDASLPPQRAAIVKAAKDYNEFANALEWVGERWAAEAKCGDCGRPAARRCKRCGECGGEVNRQYSTGNSAFWRTAKNVLTRLGSTEERWWSLLMYTNLYKVAPDGRNPSPRLIGLLQYEGLAQQLLKTEIDFWAPRRLLFLTRPDWAKPFLDYLCFSQSGFKVEGILCGSLPAIRDTKPFVVVAPHPQGKPEQELAEAICTGFRQLEAA